MGALIIGFPSLSFLKFLNLIFIDSLLVSIFGGKACRMLVPWPGIKPMSTAVEARNLNHWTAREVPNLSLFKIMYHFPSFQWQLFDKFGWMVCFNCKPDSYNVAWLLNHILQEILQLGRIVLLRLRTGFCYFQLKPDFLVFITSSRHWNNLEMLTCPK